MKSNPPYSTTQKDHKILFLHHSTGSVIFNAGRRVNPFSGKLFPVSKNYISQWLTDYNSISGTHHSFTEQSFPKGYPYGWNNYPFDYYNIWVKNGGPQPYLNEPTLELLTLQYDLIIFKHCFPVSNIDADINDPDINSSAKRLENYKLQYLALKQKLHEFPHTKFLLWTGAAQVKLNITTEQAIRARAFFEWVKKDWNVNNDNIFLWDFYELETEGELFLKDRNANNSKDSHPGKCFAERVAPLFCHRIIEVIQHQSVLQPQLTI